MCEQDAFMRAALRGESVAIMLRKPGGLANTTLRMVVEASGQTELAVDFSVTMTRLDARSGERVGANGSVRIDSPSISAFGHHIERRRWQAAAPLAPAGTGSVPAACRPAPISPPRRRHCCRGARAHVLRAALGFW